MIYQDFLELLLVLEKHRVEYAVIGGYAVGMYAEPRYTKDLDLIVVPSENNGTALIAALEEFGAPVNNLTKEDIANPGLLYIFGIEPLRVDILNRIKGASVSEIITRAKVIEINKTSIKIVDINDLITIKKLSGRPQDLVDVQNLEKVNDKK